MTEPQTSVSHPSRDEFAALLEESLTGTALQEGSVVKGTVVGIEKDVAVIDVGLKTEGRIPLKEFGLSGRAPELSVGDEVDVYLERVENAAGEAVWAAGPLTKGANLCHSTAGNGHAFLALHRRTRDPMWLERARAFAMHAIAQAEADARRFGQLRHSLWTGDVGLALYLWDCIHGQAEFPTLDVFFAPPKFA